MTTCRLCNARCQERPDGLCRFCRAYAQHQHMVVCHRCGQAAHKKPDGLCSGCRNRSMLICHRCGNPRYATADGLCAPCRNRKSSTCRQCGKPCHSRPDGLCRDCRRLTRPVATSHPAITYCRDHQDSTLREVAAVFGFSRERARQLRLKAGLVPRSVYRVGPRCLDCDKRLLNRTQSGRCHPCYYAQRRAALLLTHYRCTKCGTPSRYPPYHHARKLYKPRDQYVCRPCRAEGRKPIERACTQCGSVFVCNAALNNCAKYPDYCPRCARISGRRAKAGRSP